MPLILSGDTGVPASGMPTGSVIQTVQSTKTALQTISVTNNVYYDISGLSVSITPISTSSKILITFTVGACGTSSTADIIFRLNRNSTVIAIGDSASYTSTTANRSLNSELTSTPSMTFLDSPATTSSITYKITGSIPGGGTLTINGRQADSVFNAVSTITAMEIKF